MDNIVESLEKAYQDLVVAITSALEAKEVSGGQKTLATDAALENFKQRFELFRVACDQAEEFVESVKQRIGSECLVDEATGSTTGKSGQVGTTSLSPISAVRLEQMSKAVRWLVIELQHSSGGSSNPHPSAGFDRDEAAMLTIDGPSTINSVGTAPWATAKFESVEKNKLANPNEPEKSNALKKSTEAYMPVLETQKSFNKPKPPDDTTATTTTTTTTTAPTPKNPE